MKRGRRRETNSAVHLVARGALDSNKEEGQHSPAASQNGQKMAIKRLPFRDPRTVARDIPGILDILFPRLNGGLVASLNRKAFTFQGLTAVPDQLIEQSGLQKAMLFELAVVRAESILDGQDEPDWHECLQNAVKRQSRHYDSKVPDQIGDCDQQVAEHAASNLVAMLHRIQAQHPSAELEFSPIIPGMGWIASGRADFAVGKVLIEVKHTDRNFVSADFKQVLIYWILKYASSLKGDADTWSDCLLLNPRRNSALFFNFSKLLFSASASLSRVEIYELFRSITGQESDLL